MKKIIITLLMFVLILGMFSTTIAENEDFCARINSKLSEIESNITSGNSEVAKEQLNELRNLVYAFAANLTVQDQYNEQVLDIIGFATKAIEQNNVEYILKAKQILDIFKKTNLIIEQNNHS